MKRFLTSLFVCCISLSLQGFISNLSELSFRSISTETYGNYAPQSYNFNSGFLLDNELLISKEILKFSLENSYLITEESDEFTNSFHHNRLAATLNLSRGKNYLQLSNQFRFYPQAQKTYLTGLDDGIKQNFSNLLIMGYGKTWNSFYLDGYLGLRNLNFDNQVSGDNFSDSDLFSRFDISYQLNPKFKIRTIAFIKNDLNVSEKYNFNKIGVAFDFDEIVKGNTISANYHFWDSQAIAKIFKHNLSFDFNQQFFLFYRLRGFLHYRNHSVWNESDNKLYRVNNLFRLQARLKATNNTFITSGTILSIEKENSIFFAGLSQNLPMNMQVSAESRFSSESYFKFISTIKYYFNSINSVWISNEYTDFQDRLKQNELYIGVTTNLTK